MTVPNEFLRQARKDRGWTQDEAAEQMHLAAEAMGARVRIDARGIRGHEAGRRQPDPLHTKLYCRIYGATAEELGLVKRRTFLTGVLGSGAAVAGASVISRPLEVLGPMIQSKAEIEAITGYLRRVFAEFDMADWLFGPQLLLSVAEQHVCLIEQLLPNATGSTRLDLLRVHTRFAEHASWLYLDSGNRVGAAHWADRAMDSAQEADHDLMVAYVFTKKSGLAGMGRDAVRTVGLARAAQRGEIESPRVLAVALQQEAHGHALAGNELACHRKLDEAMGLLLGIGDEIEDEPARYCIPEFIEMWRATCWLELGRPVAAIEIFESHLKDVPTVHQRDRGVYQARLAVAHAAASNPGGAVASGREAVKVAAGTRSERITAELRRLRPMLGKWQDVPEVAALCADLEPLITR